MSAAAPLWQVAGSAIWGAGAVACLIAAARLRARLAHFGTARSAVVGAVGLTALWALAGALAGPQSMPAELASSFRNLAWLVALHRLFAIEGRHAALSPVRPLILALGFVELLQLAIEWLLIARPFGDVLASLAFHTVTLFRLLVATGGLVLVHNFYGGAEPQSRAALRWPALALAIQWGFDLNHYTVTYLLAGTLDELAALRGLSALALGALLCTGLRRGNEALRFRPSRAVMFQSASLLIIGGYLVFMVAISRWLGRAGPEISAELQLAFAGTAAAVIAIFASSQALRAWVRVTISKHLFQHRYDYRDEWLRFTRTIGRPGPAGRTLDERVIRAVADMTGSPAGVLLTLNEQGDLALASRWQWPTAEVPAIAMPAAAIRVFEADPSGGFIVDLDELRRPEAVPPRHWAPPEQVVPDWVLAEPRAWAMVPLHHFDRIVGMVVLARPALARRLDWEDFDLLRVAGQQLASYLAEQAGQEALAEAGRFDEFNRRIAFVMHDIKNLASQLGLLARNAEAHAENPAFRADMLVTLRNAADKLNALLARLSRYGTAPVERLAPVEARLVVGRVAARFKLSHQVELAETDPCRLVASEELLEQVLVHLVQNAIDASPPAVPVCLRVTSTRDHGTIEVLDSGSGMSAEFIRTGLFKPFVSTKPGGFGIGAYEARELVRAMGGTLDVESREGAGSRFTIRLPHVQPDHLSNTNAARVA